MSKGNTIITFRLDPFHVQGINVVIERRNYFTKEAPWTFSDFIRKAIDEKLHHMQRSRKTKKRKMRKTSQPGDRDGGVIRDARGEGGAS